MTAVVRVDPHPAAERENSVVVGCQYYNPPAAMSCFYRTSQQTRSLKSSSVLGRFLGGGTEVCDSRNAILGGSPCSMGVALNIRIFRADTEISSLMLLLLFLHCFILLGCASPLSNKKLKSIYFLYRNIVSINI